MQNTAETLKSLTPHIGKKSLIFNTSVCKKSTSPSVVVLVLKRANIVSNKWQ